MKTKPDFPELVGTEKQIKWAEDLRQKTFGVASKTIIETGIARIDAGSNPERTKIMIEAVVEFFETAPTDAKWWIDRRFGMQLSDEWTNAVKAALRK